MQAIVSHKNPKSKQFETVMPMRFDGRLKQRGLKPRPHLHTCPVCNGFPIVETKVDGLTFLIDCAACDGLGYIDTTKRPHPVFRLPRWAMALLNLVGVALRESTRSPDHRNRLPIHPSHYRPGGNNE